MPRNSCCLGDPVFDLVYNVPFAVVAEQDVGGCVPISPEDLQELKDRAAGAAVHSSAGGSAANVSRGLAQLQAAAARLQQDHVQPQYTVCFAGMVGNDQAGRDYQEKLLASQVHPQLACSTSGAPTASCHCLVTPDGERTMRTCLGAATELASVQQLPAGWADALQLLHCEGYCLWRPQLALGAMRAAREAGAQVSLDLASFEVVQSCQDTLLKLLREGLVDILFCNTAEAEALAEVAHVSSAGQENDAVDVVSAASRFLLQHCAVVVVSEGAQGCSAWTRAGQAVRAPAAKVQVEDTVGAGDCFAAAFLHAHLSGASLKVCCIAGCLAGTEAVQVVGANLPHEGWQRVQQGLMGR